MYWKIQGNTQNWFIFLNNIYVTFKMQFFLWLNKFQISSLHLRLWHDFHYIFITFVTTCMLVFIWLQANIVLRTFRRNFETELKMGFEISQICEQM